MAPFFGSVCRGLLRSSYRDAIVAFTEIDRPTRAIIDVFEDSLLEFHGTLSEAEAVEFRRALYGASFDYDLPIHRIVADFFQQTTPVMVSDFDLPGSRSLKLQEISRILVCLDSRPENLFAFVQAAMPRLAKDQSAFNYLASTLRQLREKTVDDSLKAEALEAFRRLRTQAEASLGESSRLPLIQAFTHHPLLSKDVPEAYRYKMLSLEQMLSPWDLLEGLVLKRDEDEAFRVWILDWLFKEAASSSGRSAHDARLHSLLTKILGTREEPEALYDQCHRLLTRFNMMTYDVGPIRQQFTIHRKYHGGARLRLAQSPEIEAFDRDSLHASLQGIRPVDIAVPEEALHQTLLRELPQLSPETRARLDQDIARLTYDWISEPQGQSVPYAKNLMDLASHLGLVNLVPALVAASWSKRLGAERRAAVLFALNRLNVSLGEDYWFEQTLQAIEDFAGEGLTETYQAAFEGLLKHSPLRAIGFIAYYPNRRYLADVTFFAALKSKFLDLGDADRQEFLTALEEVMDSKQCEPLVREAITAWLKMAKHIVEQPIS